MLTSMQYVQIKVKTNTSKQAVSFILIDPWKELPDELKLLNSFPFIKELKDHLLSSQCELMNLLFSIL